jgi:DNA-binding MarR family transcriptional regulator
MTFAGVSRHVAILETAGLVRREIRGREHWLSLQPDGLAVAQQWINEQTSCWIARDDSLEERFAHTKGSAMTNFCFTWSNPNWGRPDDGRCGKSRLHACR